MDWFRWHHGTVNDPKWRVIARRSGQPVMAVISVFAAFLERASQADQRGSIEGWDAEDIAISFEMIPEDVIAIHQAMQGKVLDGDTLTGWSKRQPKREREDATSTERKRSQREREKEIKSINCADERDEMSDRDERSHAMSHHVTPCHTQIEEIDKKENPSPVVPLLAEEDETDGFPDWWATYPRHVGKGAARKAYAKAVKTVSPEALLAGVRRYAAARLGQDESFTAHPATWLNQERWSDEPTPPTPPQHGSFPI